MEAIRIAVLSGKGGAGKTLVSVNLAAAAQRSTYVDCDVEGPNGHLFFKPLWLRETAVSLQVPKIDHDMCSGCRVCVEFCRFNAMAYIGQQVKVFNDVCHSCGGCMLLCPKGAISERERAVGSVKSGFSDQVKVISGILNTGEVTGVPVIKEALSQIENSDGLSIIDCPPGSACTVMESIQQADYCVLVTEPTAFGIHNLEMVHELVTLFKKPCGLVINKSTDSDHELRLLSHRWDLPILGRIPYDHELGKLSSEGKVAVNSSQRYLALFEKMLMNILEEVRHEAAVNP